MLIKRILSLLLPLCLLLSGCAGATPTAEEPGKIRIVATLFPQYDFARQIAGDRAEVRLLLPPGVESHSFEPTPADVIAIDKADLFFYTGEYMEPWAQSILDGLSGGVRPVDLSSHIELEHEDSGGEEHDGHDHGGYDPHIWTNPQYAKIMAQDIADALIQVDPVNKLFYEENMERYGAELDALDLELEEAVSGAERRELVFGGRFALHYFAERYGLTYQAAYDSCSSETEPSARVVAQIIDEVKQKKIPVIFYEELTDPKVARAISKETGAKLLLLHSCHNLSRDEVKAGATYISLMRQNVRNLKEGLN